MFRWILGRKKQHPEDQVGAQPVDEGPHDFEGGQNEVVQMEIDGVLDLHTFHPREVKTLVPDYLEECQKHGVLDVRIIHGKGQGTLRRIVHSILQKHPAVSDFSLAGHGSGGWGATSVHLHPSPGTPLEAPTETIPEN